MEDSKALSDCGGEQSRLQDKIKMLYDLVSRAPAQVASKSDADRLLDDEEFLERLVGRLAPRLQALQLEQGSNASRALGGAVKAFEHVAASAVKRDQSAG